MQKRLQNQFMPDKKTLREHFSNLRKQCTSKQNDALIKNLMSIPEYKNAVNIFTYISVKAEPDTTYFINASLSSGKNICVPKCNIKTHTMKFIKISSYEDDLQTGNYNIPEPISDVEFKSKPDLIIIPALSCDIYGNRLGYGGGYYDRFLSETKSGVKVAIIYDCLLCESLPVENTDIPVDIIITESRILRLR